MRAIVTIIDEKTGHVFEKDKILMPYREQRYPFLGHTVYEYRFEHSVMDDYFRRIFDQQIIEPNEELRKEIGMDEAIEIINKYWNKGEENGIHEN